jgi:hypothetical protein
MAKKPKTLNITIIFSDYKDLIRVFGKIIWRVRRGIQRNSGTYKSSYYDYRFDFMQSYSYEEKVIDGNICWTYKSKI